MENNLERFNQLTKGIFDRLVEACPVPLELKAEDFGLEPGEYTSSGMYSYSGDEIFLTSTIKWLEAEGYIRSAGGKHTATLETLRHLGRIPNVLS